MLRALHKYAGLLLGALLTLIGFSGSLLVFDHAIDDQITPELRMLSSKSSASIQLVLHNAVQAAPTDTSATRIDLARQPGSPHVVRFSCLEPADCLMEASIDPATGQVLVVREWGSYPMSWLYKFHYTLLSGDTGKTVVGTMGIVLMFFLCSGLYLWWPRKGRIRNAFRVRRRPAVRFLREFHQVIGVISMPVLLICALTGVTLVFYSQVHGAINYFSAVKAKPEFSITPSDHSLSIDDLLSRVQTAFPEGKLKRIYLPRRADQPLQVRLNLPEETWSNHGASVAWVNPYNGELLGSWNAGKLPMGNTLLTWAFPLHNADALGFAGRILWVIAGLLPGCLFVTGVLFWYQKKRRSNNRDSAA